jgi:hypothetical protein
LLKFISLMTFLNIPSRVGNKFRLQIGRRVDRNDID